MRAALVALLALVFVSGCSDHGDPSALNPADPVESVSFANEIQPIFDAQCIGCHGDQGNAGLDLRSGLSYANLVGVAANATAGILVVAGDATSSVIYHRLTGFQVGFMPPTSQLPISDQELVAEWINDGALNN